MSRLPALGLLASLFVVLAPAAAGAHQSSLTYSKVQVAEDGRVEYQILLSARDLYEALGLDSDRDATDEEIRRGEARLFDYVLARVRVGSGAEAAACPVERRGVEVQTRTERLVALRWAARCPRPFTRLVLDYDLFFDLDKAHVGRLQVTYRDRTVTRELTKGLGRFEWPIVPPVTLAFHISGPAPADLADRVTVTAGEEACPIVAAADGPPRLTVQCPSPYDALTIEARLDATGELEVSDGVKVARAALPGKATRFSWTPGDLTPWSMELLDFVHEGVEHIFGGPDHVMFLCGLLFVAAIRRERGGAVGARGLRGGGIYVLKIVTGFTVAHSITLILAALDVLTLPSRLVESAIAASIVWVAVENVWLVDPKHRFALAFGFGLVHGLGFASVLKPMLPPEGVVLPLLLMNVGVELGQIAIVVVLFPALAALAAKDAERYRRLVVVGGSALVGLAGLLWLVDRVFEIETISRWI